MTSVAQGKERQFADRVAACDPDELWIALCTWSTRPTKRNIDNEKHQRLIGATTEHLSARGAQRVDKSVLRELLALMAPSSASDSDLLLLPHENRGWVLEDQRLLIHPSSHDRPIRDIAELLRVAAVVDDILVPYAGFGISDILELHLRHSDAVLRPLLAIGAEDRREPTAEEIEAYRSVPTLQAIAETCRQPGRAAAALAWATAPPPIFIATTINDGNSSPVIRVETAAGLRDLPPSVAFDTTTASGQELMRIAIAQDDSLLDRYRDAVADEAFTLLSDIAEVDRRSRHHAIVRFDHRRMLDVKVAVNLNARGLLADVRRIESGRRPTSGTLGLIVTALPSYNEYVSFGLSNRQMIGVQDLRFIVEQRQRDEDFYLLLESTSNPRFGKIMSWDKLDQYSVWEVSGELPHGRGDGTMYAPTGCRIEWDRQGEQPPTRQHPTFPHRTMRTRAEQEIFWRLDDGSDREARLKGDNASAFLKTRVVPVAGEFVKGLISKYDRATLLSVACNQVEAIEELRHAEEAGWTSGDVHIISRVARLLLESVLADDHSGGIEPTLLDWQELLAAAEAWADPATLAAVVGRNLQRVEVIVRHNGEYEISVRSRALVDLDAYGLARAEAAVGGTSLGLRPLPWLLGESLVVGHNGVSTPEWHAVLHEFAAHFGTSVEAVLHVLLLLSGTEVGFPSVIDVVDSCTTGWRGARSDIEAAVSHLTLRAADVRSEGVQPWRNQERSHRLASHPLVEMPDDTLGVMPAWIRAAIFIFFLYLSEGRLPRPRKTLSSGLDKALTAYRNILTAGLEHDVIKVLDGHAIPYKASVKKPKVLNMRSLSGELDAICAIVSTRTIWVLEVKDPVEDFSIDALRRSLARFVDSNEYVDKLRRKVADVQRDVKDVAAALGVIDGGKWRVRAAFVTRRPVPAGFCDTDFPFTTPVHLLDVLMRSQAPPASEKRTRRNRRHK
jgi:hypothetical protein